MDFGERYLEVVLRFRRLAPSLVESYVGPPGLAARVDAEPELEWAVVADQAAQLANEIGDAEPGRARSAWLVAQLSGIESACGKLTGGTAGYRELVKRCHGVEVHRVSEDRFARAHELIARTLPASGSARERLAAWRTTQLVNGKPLAAGLEALVRELGARTRRRWELPDGERVSIEIVHGPRFAANADYRGGLHTNVAVNTVVPLLAWRMVELIAHEAYPGHHTEAVIKDDQLIVGQDRRELCVWAYPTPQALMAEAIAMLAPRMLLADEIETVGAACLRPLGIDYDIGGSAAVRQAHELLMPVRANLALMLDEGQVDRDGAWAYARRWLLEDDDYVTRLVDQVCEHNWSPYESCYTEGLRLSRAFVRGQDDRYDRLLREQLTPADLTL
jgi:hypothetical protein